MPLPILVPHMNGFPRGHLAAVYLCDNIYRAVEVEISFGSAFGDLVWDEDVGTFVWEIEHAIGGHSRCMSLIAGPYLLDRRRNLVVIAGGRYHDGSKRDQNGSPE